MSIETWKQEFMPVPPKIAAKRGRCAALRAELLMWQGTTKRALKKHQLRLSGLTLSIKEKGGLYIDIGGGPLCKRYRAGDCRHCPLVLARHGMHCYDTTNHELCSPIHAALRGDTRPMRRLLERAIRRFCDANKEPEAANQT